MTNLTNNERDLLTSIVNNEFQNDDQKEGVVDFPVWAFSVLESKADGGVMTSLQAKGLAGFQSATRSDDDDILWITAEGWDAINETTVA